MKYAVLSHTHTRFQCWLDLKRLQPQRTYGNKNLS